LETAVVPPDVSSQHCQPSHVGGHDNPPPAIIHNEQDSSGRCNSTYISALAPSVPTSTKESVCVWLNNNGEKLEEEEPTASIIGKPHSVSLTFIILTLLSSELTHHSSSLIIIILRKPNPPATYGMEYYMDGGLGSSMADDGRTNQKTRLDRIKER
jgi:hypothetical protein